MTAIHTLSVMPLGCHNENLVIILWRSKPMKLLFNLRCIIDKAKWLFLVTLLSTVLFQPWFMSQAQGDSETDVLRPVAEEIRYEATLSNNSTIGRPLPLAGHWNTGSVAGGFTPAYQMGMIEKGHFLLPSFHLPIAGITLSSSYFEEPIKKAAALKIPISFISTQWESLLTTDRKYFSLPSEQNPNVIDAEGNVLPKVCPFGPTAPWFEVGKTRTSNTTLNQLQGWYPDPPLVLFVSNNEHPRLKWTEVEKSQRYLTLYGKGQDDNFKRSVVGDGWITRYRTLQSGMKDGLTLQTWKDSAKFVGFEAFGTRAFARWGGWLDYSLYRSGRMEPWPLAWDGASPACYLDNWSLTTDYIVASPQVELMNWVMLLHEGYSLNPEFWFEISTNDGGDEKRAYFTQIGQTYSPERYGGMVQFDMWLLRPRLVREFRPSVDTVENAEPYFLAIVEAVDRVHTNPTLRKFWRKGELVMNPAYQHPYQNTVPQEYMSVPRWFLLSTNLDPSRPWTVYTELPIFSLAIVYGQAPEREWLIYAHSPLAERNDVTVTLPGYGPLKMNVNPSGTFYHVLEKDNVINRNIQASKAVPTPINFRTAD